MSIHIIKEAHGTSQVDTLCENVIDGTSNIAAFTNIAGKAADCPICLAREKGVPYVTKEQQTLLDVAERTMLQFIKTGDRMVFGRLEGMQDAIEYLNLPELREAFLALVHKHRNEMAKQTAE